MFLCHATQDKEQVRDLYHRLLKDGFRPWLDEEDLLPGQNWKIEITKAVRQSDAVIVFLSRNSVTKAGYVQKEISMALDVLNEQPEGSIFIIPLQLEECDIPSMLRDLHCASLSTPKGYEMLVKALNFRSRQLRSRS